MDNTYCPRPDYKRECWQSLNGEWQFDFEEDRNQELKKWINECTFSRKITVPYAYQTKKSGIQEQKIHDRVWYKKSFFLPENMKGKRVYLNFGAVDYIARVWLNGS